MISNLIIVRIFLLFFDQAYRGHKEMAVLLLQNGIDTTIKNHRGQLGNS